MWNCEFCKEDNKVDLEDEEIPKNEDTTFMLQPALCIAASGKTGVDESLVIFCIDTSGSMGVTTRVCSIAVKCSMESNLHGLFRLKVYNYLLYY